jgi:hypothetical protein
MRHTTRGPFAATAAARPTASWRGAVAAAALGLLALASAAALCESRGFSLLSRLPASVACCGDDTAAAGDTVVAAAAAAAAGARAQQARAAGGRRSGGEERGGHRLGLQRRLRKRLGGGAPATPRAAAPPSPLRPAAVPSAAASPPPPPPPPEPRRTRGLSDADARHRLAWAWECMAGAARVTPHLRAPGPADVPRTLGLAADRDALRHHAFVLHAAVAALFADVPVMSWAGHAGPWVENAWVDRYTGAPHVHNVSLAWWSEWRGVHGDAPGVRLLAADERAGVATIAEPFDFDLFYPFVPLFGRWEDSFMRDFTAGQARTAADRVAGPLYSLLRPDALYVTVTQRSTGFLPHASSWGPSFRNVLVLAAGGGGHVALPLLAGEVPPVALPVDRSRPRLKLSFLGKLHHAALREQMAAHVRAAAAVAGWTDGSRGSASAAAGGGVGSDVFIGHVDPPGAERRVAGSTPPPPWDWRDVMGRSELTLAPRGAGPTSFRLYEALQSGGSVPVYVHDGDPWLPYHWPAAAVPGSGSSGLSAESAPPSLYAPGLDWSAFAFLVHIDAFDGWLRDTAPGLLADTRRLDAMRTAGRVLRDRYFTLPGVMRQVHRWLWDVDASELRCTAAAAAVA